MDKDILFGLIERLENDVKTYKDSNPLSLFAPDSLKARYIGLLKLLVQFLPEHDIFLRNAVICIRYYDILDVLAEAKILLAISEESKKKLSEGKIFESAKDKMKQAGLSYKNGDYPAVFSNLNTSLELMLKEKLQIPTTITEINTANIIEILLSKGLGPTKYLKEVRKRLFLDAHTKHRGYIPQSNECVFALKAMEDLEKVLEPMTIKLEDETLENIYSFTRREK